MDLIDITSDAIDVTGCLSRIASPSSGATSCFVGTTRDTFEGKRVVRLEYEAYRSMALKSLRGICSDMRDRWSLVGVALVHRCGVVPVSEASVLVAASSVHRKEALEAVSYGIDRIKADAPIWKRERYEDDTCSWKENCECSGKQIWKRN